MPSSKGYSKMIDTDSAQQHADVVNKIHKGN